MHDLQKPLVTLELCIRSIRVSLEFRLNFHIEMEQLVVDREGSAWRCVTTSCVGAAPFQTRTLRELVFSSTGRQTSARCQSACWRADTTICAGASGRARSSWWEVNILQSPLSDCPLMALLLPMVSHCITRQSKSQFSLWRGRGLLAILITITQYFVQTNPSKFTFTILNLFIQFHLHN